MHSLHSQHFKPHFKDKNGEHLLGFPVGWTAQKRRECWCHSQLPGRSDHGSLPDPWNEVSTVLMFHEFISLPSHALIWLERKLEIQLSIKNPKIYFNAEKGPFLVKKKKRYFPPGPNTSRQHWALLWATRKRWLRCKSALPRCLLLAPCSKF